MRSDASVNTQSLYAFDTLHIGDKWIINAGLRADHFNMNYNAVALSIAALQPTLPVGPLVPVALDLNDTLVNGKLSALYKPTPESSV